MPDDMNRSAMQFTIQSYGRTDIGLIRHKNEDVYSLLPDQNVYILADGMGGHNAGDVAANEAVEALALLVRDRMGSPKPSLSLKDAKDFFYDAYKRVNSIVHQLGQEYPELKGMGTTLCSLFFHEQGIVFANVGDSRIYRLRDKELHQITKDHSLLRDLLEMGQLSKEEERQFAYKHIVTKTIGTEPEVDPTVQIADQKPGDLYLLCTDGLSDVLEFHEIEGVLLGESCLENASSKLISLAIEKGGYDNVTVLLARIVSKE